jgi:hypothetical protein
MTDKMDGTYSMSGILRHVYSVSLENLYDHRQFRNKLSIKTKTIPYQAVEAYRVVRC